jgi:putative hydrolase of the HAD superfamily
VNTNGNSIRAIIFDFGGVLCFFPDDSQFGRLAAEFGVPIPEFEAAFWQHRIPYDSGEYDARTYWTKVAASLRKPLPEQKLSLFIREDLGFWNHLDEEMLEWMGVLRRAGLKVGLLSNLPPELGAALRAQDGFLAQFDHHSFSYEVGAVKPQARIYEHCLQGLKVEPQETLFLDDRQENVRGAAELGIHAILFESRKELAPRLAAFGLPPPG